MSTAAFQPKKTQSAANPNRDSTAEFWDPIEKTGYKAQTRNYGPRRDSTFMFHYRPGWGGRMPAVQLMLLTNVDQC
jgi:hypothetical protein